LAERRKHFCKDDLFVPNRTVGVLLYTRSTLNTEELKTYKYGYHGSSSIVLIDVLELKNYIRITLSDLGSELGVEIVLN